MTFRSFVNCFIFCFDGFLMFAAGTKQTEAAKLDSGFERVDFAGILERHTNVCEVTFQGGVDLDPPLRLTYQNNCPTLMFQNLEA